MSMIAEPRSGCADSMRVQNDEVAVNENPLNLGVQLGEFFLQETEERLEAFNPISDDGIMLHVTLAFDAASKSLLLMAA